jgi:hypothetical protein
VKHGHARKRKRTSEYMTWEGMKERCNNPNRDTYKYYGGRGIKVCERWNDFQNFLEDMGPRPDGLTLERKNNNGNYEPSNCCWATRQKQTRNRRDVSHQRWFYGYGPNGEMIIENNQCYVARIFKLEQGNVSYCLQGNRKQHKGWKFKWIEDRG